MRFLKQLFDFYINSSIHVALAVYALSNITLLYFNVETNNSILCFNFFATITAYNFVKYLGVAKWHHRNMSGSLKAIRLVSIISVVCMLYYMFALQLNTLICVFIFALITFLYAIPLFPKQWYLNTQKNLREVSGVKVYVIALVWSGVTVFLPLIDASLFVFKVAYVHLLQIFIFVIALMLPFEIRDLQFDSLKLATIPQKIGVIQTKYFGFVLLIVFNLLELLKEETLWKHLVIQIIISVIVLIFIVFSEEKQNKYYSAFFVEGIPIFWLLLLQFL
ncbi:hypothetical protein [Lacinutrix salivirga]